MDFKNNLAGKRSQKLSRSFLAGDLIRSNMKMCKGAISHEGMVLSTLLVKPKKRQGVEGTSKRTLRGPKKAKAS